MKKYNTLVFLIIIAVLVMGAGCSQTPEEEVVVDVVEEQEPTEETAVVDEAVADKAIVDSQPEEDNTEISDEMKAIMDEVAYAYSGELKDVTGQKTIRGITTTNKSSGQAQADYLNNKYMLIAEFTDLPEPQDGDFYEGWVVRSSPFNFISTGKAVLENNEYINRFVSDEDWLDHSLYVLTLADKKWRDANKKNI